MPTIAISTAAGTAWWRAGSLRRRPWRDIGRAQRRSRLSHNDGRIEDQYPARLSTGPDYRRRGAGACRAADDCPADLDLPRRRQARRADDANPDGAAEGAGGGLM